jgi:hypothetical protein
MVLAIKINANYEPEIKRLGLYFCICYSSSWGQAVAQWLRHCATNRKVAGSKNPYLCNTCWTQLPACVSGSTVEKPTRSLDYCRITIQPVWGDSWFGAYQCTATQDCAGGIWSLWRLWEYWHLTTQTDRVSGRPAHMAVDAQEDSCHNEDRRGADPWWLAFAPWFPHMAAKTAPCCAVVFSAVHIFSDDQRYNVGPIGILWLSTAHKVESLSTGETTCDGGRVSQYAGLCTMNRCM